MATTSTLEQYKSEQQKLLEERQRRAKEQAHINQQKLLKYLPHRTAGQSLGMTESAKIAASNAYQQNVAAADTAYLEGMSDLNNYVRTERKAEQDEAYNSAMSVLQSGSYNTAADLRAYLDTVKDKVSDTQWDELDRYVKTVEDSPEQKAAEEAALVEASGLKTGTVYMDKNVGGNSWKKGDNIRLSDGTNQYDVQIKEATDGKEKGASGHSLLDYANYADIGENDVFSYGGDLYLRRGDTFYVLEQRTKSREADWNSLLRLYK